MNKERYELTKQGNVFFLVGLVVLIVIFAATFLVYYQMNIIVENVRRDLYYSLNDSILSFDVQDLAFKQYTIDKNKAKEVIQHILNKNYTEIEGSVTKIEVTDLKIIQQQDKVDITVRVQVTFKSVVNFFGKNEHKFNMNENVKISLLQYE